MVKNGDPSELSSSSPSLSLVFRHHWHHRSFIQHAMCSRTQSSSLQLLDKSTSSLHVGFFQLILRYPRENYRYTPTGGDNFKVSTNFGFGNLDEVILDGHSTSKLLVLEQRNFYIPENSNDCCCLRSSTPVLSALPTESFTNSVVPGAE
nr:hypothetical protein Iba_chr07aCG14170 [Ipomoea batatas]